MQINRIEFQAVGPFPGRHVIDVDALGGNGLFLLDGPTGAGKTTLIDVLVFALYGHTAGAESSLKRLRSDHADPGTETYVDVVVTLAAGTYRVRRTPEYERPRKRGTGTTTQPHTAKVWRLSAADVDALAAGEDPPGEVVATQVGEASAEVQRLVGLNRAQFTQTVVLPQGQFAAFLHARPDERRGILQQIFGTDLYERIQEHLRLLAAQRGADLRDSETRLSFLAESLAAVVGSPGEAEPDVHVDPGVVEDREPAGGSPAAEVPATVDPTEDPTEAALVLVRRGEREGLDRLTSLTGAVADDAAELAARRARLRDQCAAAQEAARAAHAEQRTLADALAERARLLTESAELASAAQRVAADASRVDLAQRAATALSPLRTLDDATTRLDDAGTRLTAAHEAALDALRAQAEAEADGATADTEAHRTSGAPGTPLPLSPAELPAPGSPELRAHGERVRDVAHRLTAERGRLTELVALERALPGRASALEARRAAVAAQEESAAAAARELEERPAADAELAAALAAAREVAATRATALAEDRAATDRLTAAERADAAQNSVDQARRSLTSATSDATAAVVAEKDLRARRIAGYAAELAGELTDGSPCLVCGSTSHPAPATTDAELPTEADIEAAEARRANAEAAQRGAAARAEAAAAELAQWRERAGGLDTAAAGAAREQAAAGLARATEAEAAAADLERRREEFARETRDREARLAAVRTELADARARLETMAADLAADAATVAAARGRADSVAARERALASRAEVLAALGAAVEAADLAAERRAAQEAEFARVLTETGLADAAAVRAGRLPADTIAELRAAVEQHRTRSQRVADALARPEIAALTGDEEADVEAATAALERAAATARAATEAAATAADRAARVRAATTDLRRQAASHLAATRDAAHVVRLANLATGGDRSLTRTRLSTYVLLRRFEDVLAAANLRLRTMSSGRYELRRTDTEGGQRSRHAGLGLEVVDHQTSRPREPRTLSGGETFYVSLCLALGMVDIVRAEAGGVDLGTLLIDEGFGTLDAETLDTVMRELTRLRDAGRTVGIVSHVAELKQAVPERIEVRHLSGRPGSTLSVTWMGG